MLCKVTNYLMISMLEYMHFNDCFGEHKRGDMWWGRSIYFFHSPLYINSDRSVKMFFFDLVLECLQAQGDAPSLLFANLVMMLSTLTYIFVRSARMKVV